MFNISYKKISNEYSGMTVDEIMKAEAEQGNTAAAKFDSSILGNPIKLIELFGLKDVGNKYAILSNMNEHDLDELLPMLEVEDLVIGLNFFTKDKLIELINELPIEQLVKLTFEMFPPDKIMQYMPQDQLDKVLTSDKMDKSLEIKYLKTLPPEVLAKMIEAATGQPAAGAEKLGMDGKPQFDGQNLFNQIVALPDDKFQEAILGMPTKNKQGFILSMAKENPKIFELFEPEAYTNIINSRKDKEDIIKSAHVIEQDQLVKMIQQLPQDLTAVVLTQIDTKKFADILIANFKDILSQIVAG
jgi:Mg/Co/Ni transporter MgtE